AGEGRPPPQVGEELPDIEGGVADRARPKIEHRETAARDPQVVGFEVPVGERRCLGGEALVNGACAFERAGDHGPGLREESADVLARPPHGGTAWRTPLGWVRRARARARSEARGVRRDGTESS